MHGVITRILETRYLDCVFGPDDGLFSMQTGYRWNSIGVRMVYACDHVSTGAWEQARRFDLPWKVITEKFGYCRVSVDPNWILSVTTFIGHPLPEGWWRHVPHLIYRPDIQAIGDRWIESRASLLLAVPNAYSRAHAITYLVNPHHPDYLSLFVRREGFWRCDGSPLTIKGLSQ